MSASPVQGGSERVPDRAFWRPDTMLINTQPPAGREHDFEEFPAIAALHYDGRIVCTSALISDDVVLTAKHCVGADLVTFGPDARRPVAVRKVRSFATAPSGVDMALLRLVRPVNRAPLEVRLEKNQSPPPSISVVGYGHERTQDSGFRRSLVAALRDWGCTHRTRGKYGCSPDFEMVVPRSGGADTCQGDSGGPALEKTPDGWRVVAVTSRGVRSSVVNCGDGGVYVRTDALGSFITRTLDRWTREKTDERTKRNPEP